jgi:hypothetical protein
MKPRNPIWLIILVYCSIAAAQVKIGEMTLSELEEVRGIIRNPEYSALIIVSEVPDLQFESTRVIHTINQKGASEWQLKVEPGRQIITIRAPGYQPSKTEVINLQARIIYRMKVDQVRAIPGTLVLNSDPPDAGVKINGVAIQGRTPLHLEGILPGLINVEIQKEQYRPVFSSLEVKSGEVSEWNVELSQSAVKVQIDLEDEDLTDVGVIINGEPKGTAPGIIYLEPGTYQLVLQKPGYEYPEKVININFDKDEIRLSEELIPLSQPIYKKWWFYAGTAAVVTAAILISSGGTEEEPPLSSSPPDFPNSR